MSNRYQSLSEFTLPVGFRGKNVFYVQFWWFIQATFFRHSPQIAYGLRRAILRFFGAQIGKSVLLRPSVTITYPWNISIGDHSWVGDDVVLYSLGRIDIGSDTVISQKCYLCGGGHHLDSVEFAIYKSDILIESEVWLAADVFVAPGVRIGQGSVIGARSSVFSSVESGMLSFGNPAKIQRAR